MPDLSPRRRVDWLYTILGLLIVGGVTFGAGRISADIGELKKAVGLLRVDVAVLQTEIRSGMADRFTGAEGATMQQRIKDLEIMDADKEKRLDAVERFCASTSSAHPEAQPFKSGGD